MAGISPVESILEDVRNGRMVILVDGEDRENEGDLVIPAQMATPEKINFMAREGRGLICLALSGDIVDGLGLQLMGNRNNSRHATAFTTSIEAKEGVTTGISAADRARTIQVAIDPRSRPGDLATPGHVFPLRARDGGVLVRAGHTEAAVDISRLAGLRSAGVICEIMNDDGTMARMPDLIRFAQKHGLKIGTIADLIAWRRRNEILVLRRSEMPFETRFGTGFHLCTYVDSITRTEHLALVKGPVGEDDSSVLVRMHAVNIAQDILGGGSSVLEKAIRKIDKAGRGVVVLIREAGVSSQAAGPGEDKPRKLRDYGTGAQILLDLGVRKMTLLTSDPKTIVALDGYGLEIAGYEPVA